MCMTVVNQLCHKYTSSGHDVDPSEAHAGNGNKSVHCSLRRLEKYGRNPNINEVLYVPPPFTLALPNGSTALKLPVWTAMVALPAGTVKLPLGEVIWMFGPPKPRPATLAVRIISAIKSKGMVILASVCVSDEFFDISLHENYYILNTPYACLIYDNGGKIGRHPTYIN